MDFEYTDENLETLSLNTELLISYRTIFPNAIKILLTKRTCISRLEIGIMYLVQLVRVLKISTLLKQACRHYLSNLECQEHAVPVRIIFNDCKEQTVKWLK